MITLHISFNTGGASIKLTSCGKKRTQHECIVAVDDAHWHDLEDTSTHQVCIGIIKEGAGDIPSGHIVLKFTTKAESVKDLETELGIYNNQLKELQGKCVPRCYGLFKRCSEEGPPLHCLVLEYVGKPVNEPKGFMSLDIYDR